MRIRYTTLFLLVIVILGGCDSTGDEPGAGESPGLSLIGSYDLVSLQDRTGEITTIENRILLAGVPNPITIPNGPNSGILVTFVITGELVLTGQSFTSQIRIETTADGQSSTFQESEAGSYTVDGATLTLNPDLDSEDAVLTWSLVQGKLTLTDDESILVFQKR